MVNEALSTFLEENPQVAKAILEKCVSASRAREAARKARELVRKKSTLETSTLPGNQQIAVAGFGLISSILQIMTLPLALLPNNPSALGMANL